MLSGLVGVKDLDTSLGFGSVYWKKRLPVLSVFRIAFLIMIGQDNYPMTFLKACASLADFDLGMASVTVVHRGSSAADHPVHLQEQREA